MGDPRLAQSRRWPVLWVHHEAEEFRVHYRETIPEMTARHVIVDLLASGQVERMNAGWLVTRPPGSRPTLQRFWGTVSGRRGGHHSDVRRLAHVPFGLRGSTVTDVMIPET